MLESISILSATLTVALLDQCYIAIWYPHTVRPFVEFFAMLLGSIFIVAVAFLILVIPIFIWLRRSHRRISWHTGFLLGFFLGALAILLMMPLFGWSVRIPLFIIGGGAGAVGVSIYARLTFKRVA